MKRTEYLLTFFLFLAAGCGEATETSETNPQPPTAPASIVATITKNRLATVLLEPATMYSGPGNTAYETLTDLPDGAAVYPWATYGEFAEISAIPPGGSEEVTGFVRKSYLPELPLTVLTRDQAPLDSIFLPACSPGTYDPGTDTTVFDDPLGMYYQSLPLELTEPIRIQIGSLTTENDWNAIILDGFADAIHGYNHKLEIQSRGDYQGNYVAVLSGEQGYNYIDLGRSSSLPIQIRFHDVKGTGFTVFDENGEVLKSVDLGRNSKGEEMLSDGLFPYGLLAFAVSNQPQSNLKVRGFSIGVPPTGKWVENAATGPGLYQLAQRWNLDIGAAIQFGWLIDRRYCQIMRRDFNLETASEFSYAPLWRGRGDHDWYRMDAPVDLAERKGWSLYGAHLAYGEQTDLPDWLLQSRYSAVQYNEIIHEHIQSIMGRYKGKIKIWSLANELTPRVFCRNAATPDYWFSKLYGVTGDYARDFKNYVDYLRMTFGWAREADGAAILIFNDQWNFPPFNACVNVTIQAMHDAVAALNKPGQPKVIDAVGMQMHLGGANSPSKEDLIRTMQYLASAGSGVKIYITEMDVDLTPLIANYPDRVDRWKIEAAIYQTVLDACLESGVCDGFGVWEIYDQVSPLTSNCDKPGCKNLPDADPTLFDKNFLPKPAYFALQKTLTEAHGRATPVPMGSFHGVNLAWKKRAEASSSQDSFSYPAGFAVDGDYSTRWSSKFTDPQWIQVDLGGIYPIRRVVLNWEASYGTAYEIQVSDDGIDWRTIYSTTRGDGGIDDLRVDGSGRYIRLYGTQRVSIEGRSFGYSLWEFEVYSSP